MPIPRLHLFELEDQPWLPRTIRDLATDYLHFIENAFALHRPAVPLVAELLQKSNTNQILDLCSGGGGPIPALLAELAAQGLKPNVVLSDQFPNAAAFEQLAAASKGQIAYCDQPVDATAVPPHLLGVRTLFNAFHHFRPNDAAKILRDAVRCGQGIGIFEFSERTIHNILRLLFMTPLLVILMTPWIRPFCWRRLFWTYIIPLVPVTCWWDGIVSQLRAYTVEELRNFVSAPEFQRYHWRADRVRLGSAPAYMTYLIGYPSAD